MDSITNMTCEETQRQRLWMVNIAAPVALLSTIHALLGAYDPKALGWIDPHFIAIMKALRYVGLECSTPGLTGPLNSQFYINQVGIAAWGVLCSTIAILVQVHRGTLTLANPDASIQRLMKTKSYTMREAEWQLHRILLWLIIPAVALMMVLFLNGVYGWSPFKIRAEDWFILLIFSVGMIYCSGALVVTLIVALAIWLRRDIHKLLS
jgi:hypothetical protein